MQLAMVSKIFGNHRYKKFHRYFLNLPKHVSLSLAWCNPIISSIENGKKKKEKRNVTAWINKKRRGSFVTTKLSSVYTGRYPLKSGNEHTIHEPCPIGCAHGNPLDLLSPSLSTGNRRGSDSMTGYPAFVNVRCERENVICRHLIPPSFSCSHSARTLLRLLDVLKFTRNDETMVASYHIVRSVPPYCCLLAIRRIP